jgi:hypothetical protein
MILRQWLRREPKPKMVRVTCHSGEKQVVEVQRDRQHGFFDWKNLVSTIEAYDPVRLEALSGDGSILRAYDVEGDKDRRGPIEGPVMPEQVEADRDMKLAALLNEAHRQGASLNADAHTKREQTITSLIGIVVDLAKASIKQSHESMQAFVTMTNAFSIAVQQSAVEKAELIAASNTGDPTMDAVSDMIKGILPAVAPALGKKIADKISPPSEGAEPDPSANGAAS